MSALSILIYVVIGLLGYIAVAGLAIFLYFLVIYLGLGVVSRINIGRLPRFFTMMLGKSLFRNIIRTTLTSVAIFTLVIVVTLVWSILHFIDQATSEKSKDFKVVVTEKHQFPSMMPFHYAEDITRETQQLPENIRPSDKDLMTWQFYGGTLDPNKRTRENSIFFFAMEASKLRSMMDDLENLDPELVRRLEEKRDGVLIGRQRLEAMNKRVGERFQVTSMNYKDIDLEFEIVGQFPEGRYNQSAVMNREYLLAAMDDYKRKNNRPHPMSERTLSLYWMRLPDSQAFGQVAARLNEPGKFSSPAVKCETASSGISSFLEAYKSLIWGMRWLLSPAILITMSLVVANAISIGVRERQSEMAVLKVLGYRQWQVLLLILGEALLIGGSIGFLSTAITVVLVNTMLGGIPFPMAFFPAFFIPLNALWWGPAVGAGTALLGSLLPALSGMRVKVSEVFSKVA